MDNESDKTKSENAICPGKLDQKDLLQARAKLASATGPEYWRSLEELAGSEEFKSAVQREFPRGASEWLDPVSRRGFLKLMSASLALAGLTSCVRQPQEAIVPYVHQPEDIVLGVPKFYATAMVLNGYAYPLLVTSHEGRPTKVEGNPEHPAALGGSDLFSQASILDLYDPDRLQANLYQGDIQPWMSFLGAFRSQVAAQRATQGASLRFLTPATSSPTMAWQMQALLQAFPQAKWYQWEPANRDNVRAGTLMAFGQPAEVRYNLLDADVILSLDADFFSAAFPGNHLYARQYAARRKADPSFVPITDVRNNPLPIRSMNRMYSMSSTPNLVMAKSDHHLTLVPSDIERYARTIASRLGIDAGGSTQLAKQYDAKWIDALVKDLQAHRGASVVIAGDAQPPVVHALAHAMNEVLGNAGKTVLYGDPVQANWSDQMAGMKELVADMQAGKVELLVMSDVNPVYDAPADLGFEKALEKVPGTVYHGNYLNETAVLCDWAIAGTHYLEHWSDARAFDGTAGIVQPLIAPMYGGKSVHELLNTLTGTPDRSGYDTVRAYWRTTFKGNDADFETWWREAVQDGFIANSATPPRTLKAKTGDFPAPSQPPQGVQLIVRADSTIHDGRFANNAWLQELPKSLSQVTWDNPVLVGPAMAKSLKIKYGDVLEISSPEGHKIERGAVWIQPGQPDGSITVFLGYGRTRAGRSGDFKGFSAYPIRTTTSPNVVFGVQVRKTGETYDLISGQGFQSMENRHIVRSATLDEFKKDPKFAVTEEPEPAPAETLYPAYERTEYAWGMSIDQNACVGCNACVVACQAENNIPVVGKEQVARGRRMHWLRVDNYYQGDVENPRAHFQPVPCMQCENAPCELVCPVGATVHSTEGLNDQVYNRCVGTRYCSNNCPYKVRRFNFLLFQDWTIPQFKMLRNPEVSVRSRGVMEKCTYCVQRITKGRIASEREGREVRDYEIQTACQQACPAGAIVFGDLNRKNTRVSQLKNQPLNYSLLGDLNTRPRTTYQAVVLNPNPEIPEPAEHES